MCLSLPILLTSACVPAEHINRAVKADAEGNSAEAISAYKDGLEHLFAHLKHESDPIARAGIAAKVCNAPHLAAPLSIQHIQEECILQL